MTIRFHLSFKPEVTYQSVACRWLQLPCDPQRIRGVDGTDKAWKQQLLLCGTWTERAWLHLWSALINTFCLVCLIRTKTTVCLFLWVITCQAPLGRARWLLYLSAAPPRSEPQHITAITRILHGFFIRIRPEAFPTLTKCQLHLKWCNCSQCDFSPDLMFFLFSVSSDAQTSHTEVLLLLKETDMMASGVITNIFKDFLTDLWAFIGVRM